MSTLRARKSNHIEVDTEGSWAISYGDMITLLLTFFILFYSTDQQKDRMEAMESSLLAVLNNNAEESLKPVAQGGRDPAVETELQERLNAKTHRVGSRLIVEFPKVSFFDFGAINLTRAGQDELRKFVSLYQPYAGNYLIGIRAYTDNRKVRKAPGGRYTDNLELSALRSVATMRVLQTFGIPLNRMRLGGYGELRLTEQDLSRAIASTHDYDIRGLALARKVVLVIEPEPRESL